MNKIKITIPGFNIEQKKIGKNSLIQVAEIDQNLKCDFIKHGNKSCSFTDSYGRKIILYLPRAPVKPSKYEYTLRVKGKIKDFTKINSNTKLIWLKHPLLGKKPSCEAIYKSWDNGFLFNQEDIPQNKKGLREPQIGALHAIASHWTVKTSSATIVMPTGTGKTEVMLSAMISCMCKKILIIVPTDTLRVQIFDKFTTLGVLPEIGVIKNTTLKPRVCIIKHGIHSIKETDEICNNANVIIATVSVFKACKEEVQKRISEKCSHLFIDEAHHLGAPTWQAIADLFKERFITQFTATPFRNDGKRIAGDIIYYYPLLRAQKRGYFKPIHLISIEEYDDDVADESIAKRAIKALNQDLKAGFDHLLMVRAQNIKRAGNILKIYKTIGLNHKPIIVHSRMAQFRKHKALEAIKQRHSRIIVCVDMLGEGFDLPNLKLAAIHDIHKSLTVTLQFTGRFTRNTANLGDATVIVNTGDVSAQKEIETLYAQDADWNDILQQQSETTIQKQIALQNVVNSFSGELSRHISLWNLRPGFSTIIYQTDCSNWNPTEFIKEMPPKSIYWHAISSTENILVVVIFKQEEVTWGRYKDIKNSMFDLIIIFWNQKHNLLFMYSSNYESINVNAVARVLCGNSVNLIHGPSVFRVFANVERPMVSNLGASTKGTIRYTMYFGPDVVVGLSLVEKAQSELNNIFGWGFENGDKISLGCAARKGKIWAHTGGTITDWRDWCLSLAEKIKNDKLDENQIVKDFLKPEEITERPNQVALAVEWGEAIIREQEDRVFVYFDNVEYKVHEIDLKISENNDSGPITIKISSEKESSTYELNFEAREKIKQGYIYKLKEGKEVFLRIGRGQKIPLPDYMTRDPFVILYADSSFSYNNFYVRASCIAAYDKDTLTVEEWNGTNIRVESQGPERNSKSIQYLISEKIKDDFDVVFNDDGSGEAADLIAMREESRDSVLVKLVHCKFSSEDDPGSRIADIYELCGQAQKSIKWKHCGMSSFVEHIKRREAQWQSVGHSRFIKGDSKDLVKLKKKARYSKIIFEISIVQPGLSKSKVSDDILQLLGGTELYLKKTADAAFAVIASK